jgi:hypothetical protein
MIDIGRIAHKAYLDRCNDSCTCFDRAWEDLGKEAQDAWRHAACAVMQYLDDSRKQMEENPELIG